MHRMNWLHRLARRFASRRPARRFARPRLEEVEARITPTGNIVLTNAFLVDSQDHAITAPDKGEEVFIEADWTTVGLPSGASYHVSYTVDGVTLSTANLGSGGGGSGTQAWVWFLGGWYAAPGTHNASVTVDPDQTVAETSYADNTRTFSFAPVPAPDLPHKFVNPLGGTPFQTWGIGNYVDVNPVSGSFADFNGGTYTYDGHTGHDIGLDNFGVTDGGVPVLAAAAGTVAAVQDGNYDRNTTLNNVPANYVVIDHGNGWRTLYFHMRTDTILVHVGDTVVAGQVLGLAGSSGFSSGPHEHFEVQHNGDVVEEEYDPTTFWVNPLPYQGSLSAVLESGVTGSPTPFTTDMNAEERPVAANTFSEAGGQQITAWFKGFTRTNDSVNFKFFTPSSTDFTALDYSFTASESHGGYWYFFTNLPANLAAGTWHLGVYINGTQMAFDPFQVSAAGAGAAHLVQGSTYVANGRTTPIDFGTVSQGAAAPQLSFTAANLGSAALTLSNLVLPTGLALAGSFPSSIAVGGSATFTLQMATNASVSYAGLVQFNTSDPNAPIYSFNIKGTVSGGNTGEIHGQVFNDLNSDGIESGADVGLTGWTVSLLNPANNNVLATTTTGNNGYYAFLNLAASNYRVRETAPTGWAQTTANPADVTVSTSDLLASPFGVAHSVATQFLVTAGPPTTLTAGGSTGFTVTAKDGNGNVATGYTGTVTFSSTDGQVGFSSNNVTLTGGAGSFTVTLKTAGSQTITASGPGSSGTINGTSNAVTVNAGPFASFLIVPQGGNAFTAGQSFLYQVQAADQYGNPISGSTFNGTVAMSTTDPNGTVQPSGSLSNGSGVFQGTLRTAGNWTITATSGSITGTSAGITITPGGLQHFALVPTIVNANLPNTAITGTAFSITVTAKDFYNNTVTGYTGTVMLSSSDGAASFPVNNYPFTTGTGNDNGVHTFGVTLNTAGSQTINAIDSGNSVFTASAPITTRGLVVYALTPTATGFTATLSKPLNPAKINVYDILLTGTVNNPGFVIPGSIVLSNSNQALTFVATNFELPDDSYSLDLISSGNPHPPTGAAPGFQELSGVPLDGGNNAGTADYTASFSTSYSLGLTVSLPGFARGPGQPVNIDLANFHHALSTAGIPIQVSGVGTATTVSFPLSYNANLLSITPVTNAPSPAGGSYSVATSGAGTNATATFTFTASGSVTASSTPITLGQLTAAVPSGAAYKTKWLLHVGSPAVQNGASSVAAVGQDGVQVVAFLGDGSGLGNYSPLDASLMANFANKGVLFPNFPLADPNLISGVDGAIDPNGISQVLQFNLNKPVPGIPHYTGAPSNNPSGPDPALAVGSGQWAVGSGQITVPVNIDDPHPAGSTGLMLATLALTYDPGVFRIAPQDIHLGMVPQSGTGWILAAVLDPGSGQIGITLYSLTPITSPSAGSLVTLDFHVLAGASAGASPIQLVVAVNAGGQEIQTALADSQGFLTLHQAPSSVFVPGLDGRALVTTTIPDPVTLKPAEVNNGSLELPAERLSVVPAEDRDFMTGMELPAEAEAAPALARVFLAGLSAGTGFPIEGGPARPAGVFPGMLSPAPQRLLELILGEPTYRWGTSIRRPELESVLWSSLQDGSDWLRDLDGGALRLPGGNQDEKLGGLPAPPAAPASTAADDGAWAEYLTEAGAELG